MKNIQTAHETAAEVDASAAVSIIRCRRPVDSILLLRRKKVSGDPWSGHFALPGGKRESGDASLLETCLRETHEETGIELSANDLEKSVEASYAGSCLNASVLVQPYLFCLSDRPEVQIEPSEIESYHWLDLASFRDYAAHVEAEMLPARMYPVFPLKDYYVWGFTYKLLCKTFNVGS